MAHAAGSDPKSAAKPFVQPKFTLIEGVVVLVFVLVIFGLMFRFVSDMQSEEETNLRRAREGVMLLNSAIGAYAFDLGKVAPSSEEGGLQVIIDAGYIDAVPLDPWGQPYQYISPPRRSARDFDLYSRGPDGIDSRDDVVHWNLYGKPFYGTSRIARKRDEAARGVGIAHEDRSVGDQ